MLQFHVLGALGVLGALRTLGEMIQAASLFALSAQTGGRSAVASRPAGIVVRGMVECANGIEEEAAALIEVWDPSHATACHEQARVLQQPALQAATPAWTTSNEWQRSGPRPLPCSVKLAL